MNSFKEEYYKELREEYNDYINPKEYKEEYKTYKVKEKVEEEQEDKKQEWIPKYKFLKDLRKNGTDSNEIYKKWKKNNR